MQERVYHIHLILVFNYQKSISMLSHQALNTNSNITILLLQVTIDKKTFSSIPVILRWGNDVTSSKFLCLLIK